MSTFDLLANNDDDDGEEGMQILKSITDDDDTADVKRMGLGIREDERRVSVTYVAFLRMGRYILQVPQ